VARTEKGKGVSFLEGKEGWHGKPLSKPEAEKALAELGNTQVSVKVEARTRGTPGAGTPKAPSEPAGSPEYKPGGEIATREAYGNALVRLGSVDKRIVVLDAEVKNSTYAEKFKHKYPDRFIECLIAEQNMVGMAMGLAPEGFVPFASSFACFLERAFDFLRIAAYSSMKHLILCGSHAGVSIGEDGPSQMALEDLAMTRSILGSVVLYPSDGFCAERLVEEAIAHGGIAYIRTSRPKTKIIYGVGEKFPIGGCKVLGRSDRDVATVIGAGVTLFEALSAQEQLKKDGIAIRVVDAYSVKPLDQKTIQACADETGTVIVVEDHSVCGGLGEAVAAAIDAKRFVHLAVREIPRSGTPKECMSRAGIDAAAIVEAIKKR
jgi:transketolase